MKINKIMKEWSNNGSINKSSDETGIKEIL